MTPNPKSALDTVPDAWMIGDWLFQTRSYRLQRGEELVKLEPRVSQLLTCLAVNAGSPVSRDTLMNEVWPGMVVGEEALTNAINKLRKAFGDDRQNPQIIETIPKAGYRLIAQVSETRATVEAREIRPEKPVKNSVRKYPLIGVAIVTLAIMAAGLFWFEHGARNATPPEQTTAGTLTHNKASLAVLPFENLGEDPQQEYFSDGITDDLITRLAKNSALLVITRDSSFFYKGMSLPLKDIAEELGVEHVLRGSIRHNGDQLVINAQLVNASDGTYAWTEQYSFSNDELFQVESNISRGVVAALIQTPESDEELPPMVMPTEHAQAHDYLMLGRYHFYKFESRQENTRAQNLFREAIELDPDYPLAYAMLGWTYTFAAMNGWADDRQAALKQAEQLADKAIALQPDLPLSYFVRGLAYREQGEYVKALVEAETALKYDPNNANNKVLLATLLYYAGRPEVGLERIKEAMLINPHHPYNYQFHLGQAYFVLRQYDKAIDAFKQGLASNPSSERLHVWLAAACAQSGDIDAARWEAENIMTTNPEFSVARMEDSIPFKDPAELKHFTDGLRLAGLN